MSQIPPTPETLLDAANIQAAEALATVEDLIAVSEILNSQPIPQRTDYIGDALVALRFNQSVLKSGFHSDEDDLLNLIADALEHKEADDIYFILQQLVEFWDANGTYELSEQMAREKAAAAKQGFPDIPCAFADDIDGPDQKPLAPYRESGYEEVNDEFSLMWEGLTSASAPLLGFLRLKLQTCAAQNIVDGWCSNIATDYDWPTVLVAFPDFKVAGSGKNYVDIESRESDTGLTIRINQDYHFDPDYRDERFTRKRNRS